VIGFFANTLVLRTTVSEEASFKTLVAAAATAALEAFAHQEVPFEKLVEVMQPPRDRSRNPIFQVNFRVVVAPVAPLALRGLEVSPLELIDTATSKFDLALEVAGIDGGTSYFEYSADLFEERTIRRMHADFERLLAGLLARPDDPLRTLAAFEEIRDRGPRAPVTKVTVSRRAVGLSHRSKGADAET